VAAARGLVALTDFACSSGGGTATVGRIEASPGVPTIVPGEVELVVDLRHPDADGLALLLARARELFDGDWEPVWRIDPVPFDAGLVALAAEACPEPHAMTSGALHDAAAMAPLVPTVMLFVASIRGISHSREEDTSEEDIAEGVRALDRLLDRTMECRA
jgi:N-carbamoyl-L-amino-acid hydrolase